MATIESNPHAEIIGVVNTDPFADIPIGSRVPLEPVSFGGLVGGTVVPEGAINWTFFEGALLTVVINTSRELEVVGTAVLLAPGLAVTATHVFSDRLPEVLHETASVSCIGPTSSGLDIWRIRKVNLCASNDIAYLSLDMASSITSDWRFRSIPVTTRAPKPGELIHVVGFQFPTTVWKSPTSGL